MDDHISRRKRALKLLRRASDRRKQQVQGFTKQEIQTLKALAASIQEAMDPNRYPSSERTYRSFWANVYFGFRKEFGKIHNSLPKRVLQSKPIREVGVDPEAGCMGGRFQSDLTASPSIERGRLVGYAEIDQFKYPSKARPKLKKDLQRRRK